MEQPVITFTEQEVKTTAAFINFLYKRASFEKTNCQDAIDLQGYLAHMSALIKKMDAHILEVKNIIKPTEPIETAKPKKGKK